MTTPAPELEATSDVWADLVGQQQAVGTLRQAVEAAKGAANQATTTTAGELSHAMTHAWLLTGPPGSGRSVAARAFAAALQCDDGGCGHCNTCRTAMSGAHPDVTICRTEQLSIKIDETRELVRKAAMSPVLGRWQVLIVEDADRVGDRAADTLLKSLEEPPARTVWVLCAPNADDMVATIRSRTREVRLVTPPDQAVAQLLIRRDGVSEDAAWRAARAAQGHIGRARALACDPAVWAERQRIIGLPATWTSLAACLSSAAEVVDQAQKQADAATAALDQAEKAELEQALGVGTRGVRPRSAAAALAQLSDQQKARTKRSQRDAIDNVLTELGTWYRDVLAIQCGSPVTSLINLADADAVVAAAAASTAQLTTARLSAVLGTRRIIAANVAPLLAIESLFVDLASPT